MICLTVLVLALVLSFPSRMVKKMLDFCFEKVYVRPMFSFEAYAENVRKKVTKCSLKITEVLLDTNGHVLTQV